MSYRSIRILRLLTPLSAIASFVAQGITVLTNEWLHTTELMPNKNYEKFTMPSEFEYNKKFTVSGLWQLCHNEPPESLMHCFFIDYFSKDDYSPDPNDSTLAVPYAAKRAAIFVFISSIILILGEFIYFVGHICRRKRVLTFVSGILIIISGLMILCGMVIYISTFKTEIGNKLRPKSTFQGPMFMYSYGYSFLFAVCSLILSELTGTFAIFLYIRQHQLDYKKQMENHEFVLNEYFPSTIGPYEQRLFCKKHGSRGRRYSRTKELSPRETSPCAPNFKSSRQNSLNVPTFAMSDSIRDLTYFNFPPFSRETTCNTVSTSADINREFSREFPQRKEVIIRETPRESSKEFTFDVLRRTTPV